MRSDIPRSRWRKMDHYLLRTPHELPCGKVVIGGHNCRTECPGKLAPEIRLCYYGWLKSR